MRGTKWLRSVTVRQHKCFARDIAHEKTRAADSLSDCQLATCSIGAQLQWPVDNAGYYRPVTLPRCSTRPPGRPGLGRSGAQNREHIRVRNRVVTCRSARSPRAANTQLGPATFFLSPYVRAINCAGSMFVSWGAPRRRMPLESRSGARRCDANALTNLRLEHHANGDGSPCRNW